MPKAIPKQIAPSFEECLSTQGVVIKKKKQLGVGTYGEVFLGELPNENDCVIKQQKRKSDEKLKKEVEILKDINCYIDEIETPPPPSIVQRKMPGVELEEIMKSVPPLTEAQKNEIMLQIAWAMEDLEEKGIVHCDIKPANIMVKIIDGYAFVSIIDFGFSEKLQQGVNFIKGNSSKGTLMYMAPECFFYSNQGKFGSALHDVKNMFSAAEYDRKTEFGVAFFSPLYSLQSDLYAFGVMYRRLLVCNPLSPENCWDNVSESINKEAFDVCVNTTQVQSCNRPQKMAEVTDKIVKIFPVDKIELFKNNRLLNKTISSIDIGSTDKEVLDKNATIIADILKKNLELGVKNDYNIHILDSGIIPKTLVEKVKQKIPAPQMKEQGLEKSISSPDDRKLFLMKQLGVGEDLIKPTNAVNPNPEEKQRKKLGACC